MQSKLKAVGKSSRGMQGNKGKYQGNVLRVRANRQRNAGKCQGNVREWVNSPGECRGMQRNAARRMCGNRSKVPR